MSGRKIVWKPARGRLTVVVVSADTVIPTLTVERTVSNMKPTRAFKELIAFWKYCFVTIPWWGLILFGWALLLLTPIFFVVILLEKGN